MRSVGGSKRKNAGIGNRENEDIGVGDRTGLIVAIKTTPGFKPYKTLQLGMSLTLSQTICTETSRSYGCLSTQSLYQTL